MARKPKQKDFEVFVDGKPASLLTVVENAGDDKVWKSYLERYRLQHYEPADRYLRSKLGDYLSAREIHKITSIKTATLDKWRKQGILEGAQLQGWWYYSRKSLIAAIKSVDIKDQK